MLDKFIREGEYYLSLAIDDIAALYGFVAVGVLYKVEGYASRPIASKYLQLRTIPKYDSFYEATPEVDRKRLNIIRAPKTPIIRSYGIRYNDEPETAMFGLHKKSEVYEDYCKGWTLTLFEEVVLPLLKAVPEGAKVRGIDYVTQEVAPEIATKASFAITEKAAPFLRKQYLEFLLHCYTNDNVGMLNFVLYPAHLDECGFKQIANTSSICVRCGSEVKEVDEGAEMKKKFGLGFLDGYCDHCGRSFNREYNAADLMQYIAFRYNFEGLVPLKLWKEAIMNFRGYDSLIDKILLKE